MEKQLMKPPYCCGQCFKRGLWPQRNYRCSFCKKGFKSAQALGGHMNVHRRDRARLRLLSPKSPYQNPNPGFSLKPLSGGVTGNTSGAVDDSNRRGTKRVSRVWKATEFVRLDLNLGLIPDVEEEGNLDLELRLGYSN